VIPNLKLVSVNTVTGESFEEDAGAVLLPEDYATLEQLNRKLRRENAALKGQLTLLRKVDPDAELIREVLEDWREQTGHPRSAIPLDGKRAAAVAKMLKLFSVEQLKTVNAVAGRFPYEQYGERFCEPARGRKRRDDAEFLFHDEVRVEKLLAQAHRDNTHGYYRDWLMRACEAYSATVVVLAMLGDREPHADVILSAIAWARTQVSTEEAA
jgi:hypothetical protein